MFGHSRQQWGKGGANQNRINPCKWKGSIEKWSRRIKMYTLRIKFSLKESSHFRRVGFRKAPFCEENIQIYFSWSVCHFFEVRKSNCTSNHFFSALPREQLRDSKGGETAGSESMCVQRFFSHLKKGDNSPGCGLKKALAKRNSGTGLSLLFLHRHAVQNGCWMAQITLHRLDRIEEQQIQITLKWSYNAGLWLDRTFTPNS